MSWFVLANPEAGRGVGVAAARRALVERRIPHEFVVCASAAELRERVVDAVGAGVERFVAVGGDGTANLVVDALLGARPWSSPPTLAILPTGSGSDFVRTFGLPRSPAAAAAHLETDDHYRVDVGVVEGAFGRRHFLNALNAGVGARAAAVAARLPSRLGGLRYAVGFWLALPGFSPAEIEVVADGRRHRGEVLDVVVANGQFFGGGMNVAPRASLEDGRFDVQVFAGPRRRAFSIMPRVVRGHHLSLRGVRRFVAAEVELRVPASWPIEADGELLGRGPVRVGILPAALDFKI